MKSVALLAAGIVFGLVLAWFVFPVDPDLEDAGTNAGSTPGKRSPGQGRPESGPTGSAGSGSGASRTSGERSKQTTSLSEQRRQEFTDMMARVFSGKASEEEQLAFWEQARTSNQLEQIMAELKEEVDADPENVDARMGLARTYVAKLMGVPAGPEKGIWSGKAESLWREVLEIEPDNWEARHSIASALSFYPPFLNKTGEAIREYEEVIAIQERSAEPTERFASTYVNLARLHQTDGNPAAALEVLELGRERHPEDTAIAERIQVLRSSFQFEDEVEAGSPGEDLAPVGEDG